MNRPEPLKRAEGRRYANDYVINRDSNGRPLARFGEGSWDLSVADQQPNRSPKFCEVVFDAALPEAWELGIRELALLNWEGKAGEVPKAGCTVEQLTRSLWLLARYGQIHKIVSPADMTQDDLDDFGDLLSSDRTWEGRAIPNVAVRPRGDDRVISIVTACTQFWTMRGHLTWCFQFNPWNGLPIAEALGLIRSKRYSNRTQPIPPEIFGPYFRYCWKYIVEYSADILAGVEFVHEMRQATLSRGVRVETASAYTCRVIKELATHPFSLDSETNLPWRRPWRSHHELRRDLIALIVSCEVASNFLTGMRPGEAACLEEGCLREELSRDGLVVRHKVVGKVYKGHGRGVPRPAVWGTIEEGRLALETLARATKFRRMKGNTKILFVTANGTPYTDSDYRYQMNKHRLYLIKQFNAPIPDLNGAPWAFCPRQLRRTCARYIAREPFGVIAGARQFQQLHVAIFEAYANHEGEMSEHLDDFEAEIGEEHLLAVADWRDELVGEVEQGTAAGPGCRELSLQFRGLVVDKGEEEARRLMRSALTTIHIGKLNFCRFRAEHALCLQLAGEAERDRPIISLCDENHCRNSCITSRHREAWTAVRDDMLWAQKSAPKGSPAGKIVEDGLAKVEAIIRKISKPEK